MRAIVENQARKHLVAIEFKPLLLRNNLIHVQREAAALGNKMQPSINNLYKKPLAKPFPVPKQHILEKTTTKKKVEMVKTAQIKPVQVQPMQKPNASGLALINPLLADPAVRGMECTGPGKPLLINRSGLIETTNISLTSDDINTFMREVSERTRIPLVQGLFKAIMGNIIITAVISDIIGTRFVIQKRGLPLPPPPRF